MPSRLWRTTLWRRFVDILLSSLSGAEFVRNLHFRFGFGSDWMLIVEPTCEKRSRREYLQDANGCRSRKPVKLSECSGTCHKAFSAASAASSFVRNIQSEMIADQPSSPVSCCQAQNMKQRRIKMLCPLAKKTYYKHYEIVRKCSCTQCLWAGHSSARPALPQSPYLLTMHFELLSPLTNVQWLDFLFQIALLILYLRHDLSVYFLEDFIALYCGLLQYSPSIKHHIILSSGLRWEFEALRLSQGP